MVPSIAFLVAIVLSGAAAGDGGHPANEWMVTESGQAASRFGSQTTLELRLADCEEGPGLVAEMVMDTELTVCVHSTVLVMAADVVRARVVPAETEGAFSIIFVFSPEAGGGHQGARWETHRHSH